MRLTGSKFMGPKWGQTFRTGALRGPIRPMCNDLTSANRNPLCPQTISKAEDRGRWNLHLRVPDRIERRRAGIARNPLYRMGHWMLNNAAYSLAPGSLPGALRDRQDSWADTELVEPRSSPSR